MENLQILIHLGEGFVQTRRADHVLRAYKARGLSLVAPIALH